MINACEHNDVKLQVVKALRAFIAVTGHDLMTSSLTQLLAALAKEKYWRVRKAVVALAIAIGAKSADTELFED